MQPQACQCLDEPCHRLDTYFSFFEMSEYMDYTCPRATGVATVQFHILTQ